MREIRIAAKMGRTEVLVRRETATVAIVLTAKPKLHELPKEEQEQIFSDARKELDARGFNVDKEAGKAYICNGYFAQFFHVEVDEGSASWEYDGGEVSTLSTHYDRRLEYP